MRVIDVRPQGIIVLTEYTMEQVNMILDFLDHCTMTYDSEKEPEMEKADKYVKTMFADLQKLTEEFSEK